MSNPIQNFIYFLNQQGITEKALSFEVGTSIPVINRWKNGRVYPTGLALSIVYARFIDRYPEQIEELMQDMATEYIKNQINKIKLPERV